MSNDVPPPRRLSPRLMFAIFAVLFGVLALGYFLFLRADYVPVFSQIRPADASAIVAQLDGKNIAYRLGDGGTTIRVPSDQADVARLAIAGSDIALKGGVGFELFNKSDMGLTDFAQRINYQRALQGELERSIMMIEQVETARVHLALPERTIFRSERSNAKAAVEVVAKPGKQFDEPRVAGIQRLVAFAVPDLAPADVVVLDGNGRVLSQSGEDTALLSPGAEEQRSVQGYYRARARAALQQALPGVQADIKVIVLGGNAMAADAGVAEAATSTPVTGTAAAGTPAMPTRNFRLRVIVATGAPLNAEETTLARGAIVAAIALDETIGDELSFQVGLASSDAAPATVPLPQNVPSPGGNVAPPESGTSWFYWIAGSLLLLIAGALLVPRIRNKQTRLDAAEREAMIDRVRAALRQSEPGHVAA